jgi:hypothetical protein
LVLSSIPYNEADYIRDIEDFKNMEIWVTQDRQQFGIVP